MSAATPSKLEIFQEYLSLQKRAMPLLFDSDAKKNAGRLKDAAAAYGELVQVLTRQLELAEVNNRCYPDTLFEIPPIVNPLMNAQLTLSDVLESLGKREEAEALRDTAVGLAEKYVPGAGTAERQRQRAQSLLAQSRYPEALVALRCAHDEFRRHGDLLQMASVTCDIAEALEWLGDDSRALAEAQTAASLVDDILQGREPSDRDIADHLRRGELRNAEQSANLLRVWLALEQTVARVNRRLGNLDDAEAHFRRVLPRVPQSVRAAIEFQLAVIAIMRGQRATGLRELDSMVPQFTGLMRPKLGVLLSWKAEALLGMERPREALPAAEEAVRELAAQHDTDSLWKAQWRLGRTRAALGEDAAALEAYVLAAQTVDNLRKAPLGYRLDSTYMADKLPLFDEAIGLACKLGEAGIGCTLIELVKSRALVAALSTPAVTAAEQGSDLEREVDVLSQQIDALEYAEYCGRGSEDGASRRQELLERRALLLERIRYSDPRWRSLSAAPAFEPDKVLELLGRNGQSALTLFCRTGEVVAVLLSGSGCRIAAQPLSSETNAALQAYVDNLRSVRPDPRSFDPAAWPALSADSIVPPELIEEALRGGSLVVVPHGRLHLLPWAGLVLEGRRLFERCPVGVLPNLSCIVALQAEPVPAPSVALFGAPEYGAQSKLPSLPFAEAELQEIAGIYAAGSGTVGPPVTGGHATQASFRRLASEKSSKDAILHVACHGSFETGDPMNSGLLLADGRLDAADLARIHLPFTEVVLSACSTGYRPTVVRDIPLSGDDVLGLPAALLEAGARALLVSIPPARDDATLALMTVYHEQRSTGHPPLQSLRTAQLTLQDDPLYPAHLWIGFTQYACR